MAELLGQVAGAAAHDVRTLAEHLLAAARRPSAPAPAGPAPEEGLSERELEVLQLLATELRSVSPAAARASLLRDLRRVGKLADDQAVARLGETRRLLEVARDNQLSATDRALLLLVLRALLVLLLLVLIMRLRLHAFVALVLVSLLTAIAAGIPLAKVVPTMLQGFGATLATVALLVFLLTRVEAAYKTVTGQETARRTAPWLRSMRGERPELAEQQGLTGFEKGLTAAVVLGVVVFEGWFFLFAGSSI